MDEETCGDRGKNAYICIEIVMSSVLYGTTICEINAGMRNNVGIFEMGCLMSIRGVTLKN